ncbi:MAG: GNAT family N-acetyltransferase [Microcoleaceae cyanobacterium MO_207.B10]|nr:GNAT family N-acetyltransferase [Microcoleaceae cyanobacterium MO_207.B10]
MVLGIYNFENLEVYGLFVSPKFTRQGIGTRLLENLGKIAIRHFSYQLIVIS